MTDLRTVYPKRIRVIDRNGKYISRLPAVGIDISRVETTAQGCTRASESALHHVVLSRMEVKDNGVDLGGGCGIRRESDAIDANLYVVRRGCCDTDES